MITMMTAITIRRWISPPPTWPMKPRSQSTSRMTTIVQSMVFLSIELAVIAPQRRDSIKQKIDIFVSTQESRREMRRDGSFVTVSLTTVPAIPALAHQSPRSCRDCGRVFMPSWLVRLWNWIRVRSLSSQYFVRKASYFLGMGGVCITNSTFSWLHCLVRPKTRLHAREYPARNCSISLSENRSRYGDERDLVLLLFSPKR